MSPLVAGALKPWLSKLGSMAALMHTGNLEKSCPGWSYVDVSPFWNLLPLDKPTLRIPLVRGRTGAVTAVLCPLL